MRLSAAHSGTDDFKELSRMNAIVRLDKQGCAQASTPSELQTAPAALLKVTARWCGPCERIQPQFVTWCKDNSERFSAFVLDVDDAEVEGEDTKTLLDLLDASALPTFIAFSNGVEVSRCTGGCMESVRNLCSPFLHPHAIEESCGDCK